jgi:AAA+ ATPase superfamily predicted ATPase
MGMVIGRENQLFLLNNALISNKSELVAVYGRRRVGKTFLIRETYKKHFVFELSGIPQGDIKDQLMNFYQELVKKSKKMAKYPKPANWMEAFSLLEKFIDGLTTKGKKVIFLDEFPWIYTQKSKFIQLFAHFWNNYCSKRSDLVVVICGSSASFMVNKVINDKFGLHNRITLPIRLLPFNLYETELYLKSRKIHWDRYAYVQLYMAIGGIPHYLEKIQRGDSVATAIDRLCFKKDGVLVNEFNQVFTSLFENASIHIKLVETLALSQKGLTRSEIISKSNINSGGTLSHTLRELIESGFVSESQPYNKVKETLYRLSDEYSIFYQRFIKPNKNSSWVTLYNSRSYITWCGFAFETLCLKHVRQIIKQLGISGMSVNSVSWRNSLAQIDLLLDRSDRCINLCEIKFSESEFVISKSYLESLQRKKEVFKNDLKSRKNLFVTFITAFGVKENDYYNNIVDNQITIDSFFMRD